MSLLTLIQDAAPMCGVRQPSSVASNTDETVTKLKTIAQMEGDELARAHHWRRLKVQTTITGDGSTTTWPLPDDFDRHIAGDNIWLDFIL